MSTFSKSLIVSATYFNSEVVSRACA